MSSLELLCRCTIVTVFCSIAAFSETAVFWVSAPVKAGETVLVNGYFPQAQQAALRIANITRAGKDWGAVVSAQGRSAEIVKATENAMMFVLPRDIGQGVFGFRLDQPGENPIYGRVNLPEIWWTLSQPDETNPATPGQALTDEAMPGEILRVFGRSLSFSGVVAELSPESRPNQVLAVSARAENDYAMQLRIPGGMAPGRYVLRVLAAQGAQGGESSGRTIEVSRPAQPELGSLNLLDFGAKPQAGFDNSGALGQAFERAQAAGGAVILLPPGGYFFAQPIRIPPHVYLRGASEDQTAIYFPEADPAPDAWISGSHHFGIANITIFCANHKSIVASDMSGRPDASGHVTLRNVRIRGSFFRGHPKNQNLTNRISPVLAGGGVAFEAVRLSGPDLQILDCDILGSSRSLYVFRGKGAVVQGNTIQNGFMGWYNFNASQEVIFENNKVSGADLMSTGGSYSTWGPPKVSQNFYTAENSYSQMLGWDREAFTSDGGGGAYYGKVAQAEGNRLVLDGTPPANWNDWYGALVAIINGKGLGQWRTLSGANGQEVQLSTAFQIAPDPNSIITIAPMQFHYLFYHNRFSESGLAIQYYGTAIEHIAEGNEVAAAGGIFASSRNYSHGISPEIGVQFIGNIIQPGFNYASGPNGANLFAPSVIDASSSEPGRTIGMVLRRNQFQGQSVLRIRTQSPAGMRAVLVDGNQLAGGAAAIEIDKLAAAEVVVR